MDEFLARKGHLEDKRSILLQELEQVDAKITEVQAGYGAIYNKRNPILRLPVEVTCLIFSLAQLPRSATRHNSSDDSSEDEEDEDEEEEGLTEVVVSHVCRQWRAISLGFPKLWNTFYFEANPSGLVPLELFDAYMERSATLPLHIWFEFNQGSDDTDNVLLVERAIRHVHRWRHFTLMYGDQTVMNPLRQLRELSSPMLEYLTLAPDVDDESDSDDPEIQESLRKVTSLDPGIFKGGAPKLTYLKLDGYSIRHALPPLSNLTILRVEKQLSDDFPFFEPHAFLDLLRLPSLTQLSLVGNIVGPFDRPRCIQMPSLKRFRVGEFDLIWHLLPSICAPQLDTLIIHMCHWHPAVFAEEDLSANYPFPELRKLYVIDSILELSVFQTFIQATRQASDVLISDMSTSLLRRILDEGCADVVWPRLKTLSIITTAGQLIDPLVTFAQSRPRHSFSFRLPAAMAESWEEGIQTLALMVSSVVIHESAWVLYEPFWPQDVGLCSRFDFGKDDSFSLGEALADDLQLH